VEVSKELWQVLEEWSDTFDHLTAYQGIPGAGTCSESFAVTWAQSDRNLSAEVVSGRAEGLPTGAACGCCLGRVPLTGGRSRTKRQTWYVQPTGRGQPSGLQDCSWQGTGPGGGKTTLCRHPPGWGLGRCGALSPQYGAQQYTSALLRLHTQVCNSQDAM
jgi:hypothetical protein